MKRKRKTSSCRQRRTETPQQVKQWYMCLGHVVDNQEPNVFHETLELAQSEAFWWCQKSKKTTYVAMLIGSYSPPLPVLPTFTKSLVPPFKPLEHREALDPDLQ